MLHISFTSLTHLLMLHALQQYAVTHAFITSLTVGVCRIGLITSRSLKL